MLVFSVFSNICLLIRVKSYENMEESFLLCADDMMFLSNYLEKGNGTEALEWSRKSMDHISAYAEQYKKSNVGWENFLKSDKTYTPNK
jgi:hypothetical protein